MFPLMTGAAALAAVGFAGYHSVAPRSQVFGSTFIGTPGAGRKLALTYDDGPNDPDTLRLLDVLARHQVKATFFLIGKYVERRPDIVRLIAETGHVIGNHTYAHPNLALVSKQKLVEELAGCESALKAAQSVIPENATRLFRPPFGLRRPATLRVARELGYVPVQWSVTCYDWKETTADRVEQHAVRQIRGGDIILMHDGGHKNFGADRKHTVEATDRLITKYKNEGYEFVTVAEMLSGA